MNKAQQVIKALSDSVIDVVTGTGTLIRPVQDAKVGTRVEFVYTSQDTNSVLRVKGTGAWQKVNNVNLEDYLKDIRPPGDKSGHKTKRK